MKIIRDTSVFRGKVQDKERKRGEEEGKEGIEQGREGGKYFDSNFRSILYEKWGAERETR